MKAHSHSLKQETRRMMSGIKFFSILLLVIFSSIRVVAVGLDSLKVSVKPIPETQMEELLSDKSLQYPIEPVKNSGILSAILSWIGDFLGRMLNSTSWLANNAELVKNLIYFLSALVVGYLLYKLLGARITGLFKSDRKTKGLDFSVEEENIHAIDFEQAIQQAVSQQQFRLAIRLVYLRSLKILSDNEIIQWTEGKTNDEYLYEIKNVNQRIFFEKLSSQFTYVWYGHFDANEQTFQSAMESYNQLNQKQN